MIKLRPTNEARLFLNLGKDDFQSILKFNTDRPSMGSIITDLFSTKHTKYKGEINSNDFVIRFKTQLYKFSLNYAIIKGTFEQESEKLKVNITVSSANNLFYLFLVSLMPSFLIAVLVLNNIANDIADRITLFSILSVLLILIVGIEFFRMQSGVKKAMKEITADFKVMTRKNLST